MSESRKSSVGSLPAQESEKPTENQNRDQGSVSEAGNSESGNSKNKQQRSNKSKNTPKKTEVDDSHDYQSEEGEEVEEKRLTKDGNDKDVDSDEESNHAPSEDESSEDDSDEEEQKRKNKKNKEKNKPSKGKKPSQKQSKSKRKSADDDDDEPSSEESSSGEEDSDDDDDDDDDSDDDEEDESDVDDYDANDGYIESSEIDELYKTASKPNVVNGQNASETVKVSKKSWLYADDGESMDRQYYIWNTRDRKKIDMHLLRMKMHYINIGSNRNTSMSASSDKTSTTDRQQNFYRTYAMIAKREDDKRYIAHFDIPVSTIVVPASYIDRIEEVNSSRNKDRGASYINCKFGLPANFVEWVNKTIAHEHQGMVQTSNKDTTFTSAKMRKIISRAVKQDDGEDDYQFFIEKADRDEFKFVSANVSLKTDRDQGSKESIEYDVVVELDDETKSAYHLNRKDGSYKLSEVLKKLNKPKEKSKSRTRMSVIGPGTVTVKVTYDPTPLSKGKTVRGKKTDLSDDEDDEDSDLDDKTKITKGEMHVRIDNTKQYSIGSYRVSIVPKTIAVYDIIEGDIAISKSSKQPKAGKIHRYQPSDDSEDESKKKKKKSSKSKKSSKTDESEQEDSDDSDNDSKRKSKKSKSAKSSKKSKKKHESEDEESEQEESSDEEEVKRKSKSNKKSSKDSKSKRKSSK